jgi:uncharacterized protein YkwD
MRFVVAAMVLAWSAQAGAVGESDANGFPNWSERVIHEWMNRARVEPQLEMKTCGARCGEAACFKPEKPLAYDLRLNRAARFHSDEQRLQGYFDHDSPCVVTTNIDALYPKQCDGAAACACMGAGSTSFGQRVGRFGVSGGAEIIAGATDPNQAFYSWLYENSASTACAYSSVNGHRWSILTQQFSVGVGASGPPVGDFSIGAGPVPAQIPSAAHYPRQAASVEVWANWYDTAGPKRAQVVVNGTCTALTRMRGTDENGAWTAMVSGVGSGCVRYWFSFEDSSGREVTFPTTGSLGIGPAGSCADWDSTRPAKATGCDAVGMVPDGGGGGDTDAGTGPNPMPAGCACAIGSSRAHGTIPFVFALLLVAWIVRRTAS